MLSLTFKQTETGEALQHLTVHLYTGEDKYMYKYFVAIANVSFKYASRPALNDVLASICISSEPLADERSSVQLVQYNFS